MLYICQVFGQGREPNPPDPIPEAPREMANVLSIAAQAGQHQGRKVNVLANEVLAFTFSGDQSAEGQELRFKAQRMAVTGDLFEALQFNDTKEAGREIQRRLMVDVSELQMAFSAFCLNVLCIETRDDLELNFGPETKVGRVWEILRDGDGELAKAARINWDQFS